MLFKVNVSFVKNGELRNGAIVVDASNQLVARQTAVEKLLNKHKDGFQITKIVEFQTEQLDLLKKMK